MGEAKLDLPKETFHCTFFAQVFNTIEKYLTCLETDEGLVHLLELYHKHWLHQDQVVSVIQEGQSTQERGVVKCIDEFGYIVVQMDDGTSLSLRPDTNRFDMMQNLIFPVPKSTKQ